MRSLTILATLALTACNPGNDLETRTFRLESISARQASEIVGPYVYFDREGRPGDMSVTEGALTVRETPDNLDRIASVLEEYDRSPAELRLHFQVIEADGFQGADPSIADVEEELRRLFRFDGYRLAGEGVIAVADQSEFEQLLTGRGEGWSVRGTVYRPDPNRLQLSDVSLWNMERGRVFETSVNLRPGQTLVMGSARAPDGDGSVILTVRAEELGASAPAANGG